MRNIIDENYDAIRNEEVKKENGNVLVKVSGDVIFIVFFWYNVRIEHVGGRYKDESKPDMTNEKVINIKDYGVYGLVFVRNCSIIGLVPFVGQDGNI